jgi:hypothetical protein
VFSPQLSSLIWTLRTPLSLRLGNILVVFSYLDTEDSVISTSRECSTNLFYTRTIDNVLWLPRNPTSVLDLDDTVDMKTSIMVEASVGRLGMWLGLAETLSPTSLAPMPTPPEQMAVSPVMQCSLGLSEVDGTHKPFTMEQLSVWTSLVVCKNLNYHLLCSFKLSFTSETQSRNNRDGHSFTVDESSQP